MCILIKYLWVSLKLIINKFCIINTELSITWITASYEDLIVESVTLIISSFEVSVTVIDIPLEYEFILLIYLLTNVIVDPEIPYSKLTISLDEKLEYVLHNLCKLSLLF